MHIVDVANRMAAVALQSLTGMNLTVDSLGQEHADESWQHSWVGLRAGSGTSVPVVSVAYREPYDLQVLVMDHLFDWPHNEAES